MVIETKDDLFLPELKRLLQSEYRIRNPCEFILKIETYFKRMRDLEGYTNITPLLKMSYRRKVKDLRDQGEKIINLIEIEEKVEDRRINSEKSDIRKISGKEKETSIERESFWVKIKTKSKIRPFKQFLNDLENYSNKALKNLDLKSVFLDTIKIDPTFVFHKFLMHRAKTETISYGTIPLYEWFSFFSIVLNNKTLQLRCIAAILERYPIPFICKANNKQLTEIYGYYNMMNIIECLLNFIILKMKQSERFLKLNGSTFDIYEVIDEMTKVIALSPKVMIKELRGTFSFVMSMAGVLNKEEYVYYYEHEGWTPNSDNVQRKLNLVKNPNILEEYGKTLVFKNNFDKMNEMYDKYNLLKLRKLSEAILGIDLNPENTVAKHFINACSLLMDVMMVAGYGRGLKQSSAAKSSNVEIKNKKIARKFEENLVRLHNLAVTEGYIPLRPNEWESTCIGFWKSTSAGVGPRTIRFKNDYGTQLNMRTNQKPLIGMKEGKKLFSRNEISKKLVKSNPGKVGARDVPYKATRLIYVVKLPTLHCQIPLTLHLQDYLQGMGRARKAVGTIDASHFTLGEHDTLGKKLLDDMSVIGCSGSLGYISLDLDFSEFDSHNVWSNFREPMINGLKRIYADVRYESRRFGDDLLTYDELIEYGYGKGYIDDTYWDVGRILFYYSDEYQPFTEKVHVGKALKRRNVESNLLEDSYGRLNGADAIIDRDVFIVREDKMNEEIVREKLIKGIFKIGYRLDGEDAFFLTSEASGEYTTLIFNTIENQSLVDIILDSIKDTTFGKKTIPVIKKSIGDDISIMFKVIEKILAFDVDELLNVVSKVMEECGHLLSIPKTHVRILKSDYRQSYATHGLMIPKDQIMIIPSERPRDLLEVDNYLRSRRRVYCTKISRGMREISAYILYLFELYKLSGVKSRFSDLKFGDTYQKINFSRSLYEELKSMKYSINLERVKYTFNRKLERKAGGKQVIMRRSLISALMPIEAGGFGLSMLVFPLYVTPSIYYAEYCLNSKDVYSMNHIYYILLFIYSSINFDISYTKGKSFYQIDFDTMSLGFVYNKLITEEQRKRIEDFKATGLSLGRYNAENAVKILANSAISKERNMSTEIPSLEEDFFITFLEYLEKILIDIRIFGDEFVLGIGLNYKSKKIVKDETDIISLINLDDSLDMILCVIGTMRTTEAMRATTSKLRGLISRSPLLRNVLSPEIVYRILLKYDCINQSTQQNGLHVLERMGFSISLSSEILDLVTRNPLDLFEVESLGGAWTDDMFGLLDIFTKDNENSIGWEGGLRRPDRITRLMIMSFIGYLNVRSILYDGYKLYDFSANSNIGRERKLSKILRNQLSAYVGCSYLSQVIQRATKGNESFIVSASIWNELEGLVP